MIGLCLSSLVVRNCQSCQLCEKDNHKSLHVGLRNVSCLLYTATLLCEENTCSSTCMLCIDEV